MHHWDDSVAAGRAVDDPTTPGPDLAQIAALHPALQGAIVWHPKVNAGLLSWLTEKGDPQVARVARVRLGARGLSENQGSVRSLLLDVPDQSGRGGDQVSIETELVTSTVTTGEVLTLGIEPTAEAAATESAPVSEVAEAVAPSPPATPDPAPSPPVLPDNSGSEPPVRPGITLAPPPFLLVTRADQKKTSEVPVVQIEEAAEDPAAAMAPPATPEAMAQVPAVPDGVRLVALEPPLQPGPVVSETVDTPRLKVISVGNMLGQASPIQPADPVAPAPPAAEATMPMPAAPAPTPVSPPPAPEPAAVQPIPVAPAAADPVAPAPPAPDATIPRFTAPAEAAPVSPPPAPEPAAPAPPAPDATIPRFTAPAEAAPVSPPPAPEPVAAQPIPAAPAAADPIAPAPLALDATIPRFTAPAEAAPVSPPPAPKPAVTQAAWPTQGPASGKAPKRPSIPGQPQPMAPVRSGSTAKPAFAPKKVAVSTEVKDNLGTRTPLSTRATLAVAFVAVLVAFCLVIGLLMVSGVISGSDATPSPQGRTVLLDLGQPPWGNV